MSNRIEINNLISYLILILIVAYCSTILFSPQLSEERHSEYQEQEVLANIISITNGLRLKRGGELAWRDLDSLQDLRDGDMIFTNENSKALISYMGGVRVELEPNTLLEIVKNENTLEIKLKKGYLRLSIRNFKKGIKISSLASSVSLKTKGSNLNVLELNTNLRLNVTSGEVLVKGAKDNEYSKLVKNESVVISNNKSQPLVKGVNFENRVSLSGITRIITTDQIKVSRNKTFLKNGFKKEDLTKEDQMVISLYPDMYPVYKQVKKEDKVITGLEDGQYFWESKSDNGRFRIRTNSLFLKPPFVSFSYDLTRISGSEEAYTIDWGKVEGAQAYIIKIFRSDTPDKVVFEKKVNKNNIIWKEDIIDSYSYRLISIDENGIQSQSSEIGLLVSPIAPFDQILNK